MEKDKNTGKALYNGFIIGVILTSIIFWFAADISHGYSITWKPRIANQYCGRMQGHMTGNAIVCHDGSVYEVVVTRTREPIVLPNRNH